MILQPTSSPNSEVLPRIYLDNAATTWPKCEAGLAAAQRFLIECGATSGRGSYASAMVADRWLSDARAHLARLIGADNASDIAICNSGTHALNAALWGVLEPGDHVITTGMDHNSLLRPLKNLERQAGISVSIVPSTAQGFADPRQALKLLRPETKLLAVGHASNVTGKLQDVTEWSRIAKANNSLLLVDASQTLGYFPIDVNRDRIDLLASAGHKGLRALHGTGLLCVRGGLQANFKPLLFGGTGLASEQLTEGQAWPHSVEVGNLNMPGVVSLAVAAAEAAKYGHHLSARWRPQYERLVRGLAEIEGMTLVGFETVDALDDRVPVVSVQIPGWDVHDLASVLDTTFGIEVRAGWHCAALVHDSLGTAKLGGTLRLSPGVSTTLVEIENTLSAFQAVLGQ